MKKSQEVALKIIFALGTIALIWWAYIALVKEAR